MNEVNVGSKRCTDVGTLSCNHTAAGIGALRMVSDGKVKLSASPLRDVSSRSRTLIVVRHEEP